MILSSTKGFVLLYHSLGELKHYLSSLLRKVARLTCRPFHHTFHGEVFPVGIESVAHNTCLGQIMNLTAL
jgi:hypothetical protein